MDTKEITAEWARKTAQTQIGLDIKKQINDDVIDVLKRFGYSGKYLVAGYLHDSIEDDGISYNDIKKHFGVEVAVKALSNV